ncbi:MAG: DNA adenine methylase, partial [Candidatus Thermoplasmatota archaeon]|nr:DNA adenine methylase [Candidatus Thermoplasmatota archaeon]
MGKDWNDLAHPYWGRKPLHEIKQKILETSKGDIIFDPFCGSGTVVIEALKEKRRIIALDINPMATFITKVNATPINLYLLTQEYEKIKYSIFKKINDMYNIKCEKCNNMHPFSSAIWEQRGKTSTLINIRVQKKSYPSDETCQFNGFIEPNYKLNKNQLLQQ